LINHNVPKEEIEKIKQEVEVIIGRPSETVPEPS
jgi:hypothetical protein